MEKIKILHFPSAVSFFWPLPHRHGRPPTSFIPPNAGFPEPVDELASFPDVGMKLILSCWFFLLNFHRKTCGTAARWRRLPIRLIPLLLFPLFNYNTVKTLSLMTINARIIHASPFPCFAFTNQPDNSDTPALLPLVTVSKSNNIVKE